MRGKKKNLSTALHSCAGLYLPGEVRHCINPASSSQFVRPSSHRVPTRGWREGVAVPFRVLLLLVHGGYFLQDLLLRVGALRQLVQVLHVVEALGDALGRHAGLGVVVPALHDGGAHHLNAL